MNILQGKIYNYLLDNIHDRNFGKNDRIPTENELGQMFSTNRMNAHYAVKELERSGILLRKKGRGTFVSQVPKTYYLGKLKSVVARRICVLNQCRAPSNHIHWNNRIINELKKKLTEVGIETTYYDVSGFTTLEEYKKLLKQLLHSGCNGMIIIDSWESVFLSKHMEIFFEFHDNIYIFDRGFREWRDLPYNVISINVFGEGVIAAEYLLAKGYTDVIFCKLNIDEYWLRERISGMQMVFARNQVKKEIVVCELNADGVDHDLMQKIKSEPGKYTLTVQNDGLASRIVDACTAAGLKVGKDFRTISFDNDSDFRSYDLTTVSPKLERIGKYLAAVIKKNMDKNSSKEILCVKINSELIVRSSC